MMKRKQVSSLQEELTVTSGCTRDYEMQVPLFSKMTDGVFDKQKGKNLVAHVDDIVVKSDKKETHIQDL